MPRKVDEIPVSYESATPYLIVQDAARALEFYQKAFGATEIMRVSGSGGSIGHAEIKIGKAIIMLEDEFPDMNSRVLNRSEARPSASWCTYRTWTRS